MIIFLGESKSASLADSNFGSGFGLSSSTAQTSWSSPLAPSSLSSLITSQPLNPIFGPDFNKNTFSTSVPSSSGVSNARFHFEVGDGLVTEPSSTNLTFGSFSNRDTFTSSSGSSNSLMSSQGFADTSEMKTTTTSLAFGVEGKTSDSSAVAKPLFPTVSSSSSTLNAAKADKGKSGARLFVRSFAFAKEGLQQNEYKEKSVVKTTGLGSTANLTSLVIKDIPEMYNKNTWLKKFYSRFGEVIKVVCSAARQSATVTFKAHVSTRKYFDISVTCMFPAVSCYVSSKYKCTWAHTAAAHIFFNWIILHLEIVFLWTGVYILLQDIVCSMEMYVELFSEHFYVNFYRYMSTRRDESSQN